MVDDGLDGAELGGGLTGGVPFTVGSGLLDRLLGQAGPVVATVVFFPLATTAAARLVRSAVRPPASTATLAIASSTATKAPTRITCC